MEDRAASISQQQLQQQLQEKDQRISQLQGPPPPSPTFASLLSSAIQSLVEIAFSGQADKVCNSPTLTNHASLTLLQHVASAGWIEEVLRIPTVATNIG